MKALILNSGLGQRMGDLTAEHPKCMTGLLRPGETILSRQLNALVRSGITETVMTTGYYDAVLTEYCRSLGLPIKYDFVYNPLYAETNYIYSIYCAGEHLKDDDILLMHGDLVFEQNVLDEIIGMVRSCMKVSSTLPLPEKDFKAVVKEGKVRAVGVEFFDSAMEAQALYHLRREDWRIWLDKISEYCETGRRQVYAEKALNDVTDRCEIYALDVKDRLCAEVDNEDDLAAVIKRLEKIEPLT